MSAPPPPRPGGAALAFVLSLAWLGCVWVGVTVLGRQGLQPDAGLVLIAIVVAAVVPVGLIWLSVLLAQSGRALAALERRVAAMAAATDRLTAAAARQAPAVPEVQRRTEDALALFVSRREAALAQSEAGADQTGLLLDPPLSAAPLSVDDLIRALDFPRDASDAQGFDLLRRALHDPGLADLIRAAEAVLSGLAADGIEVRDLAHDRARPEVWRAFAQGARGPAVADLGGVRDRAVLSRAAARMRADPAFREAAHRFLRGFDRRLAVLDAQASDAQIARLAETRAARAFMILGRTTGIFG